MSDISRYSSDTNRKEVTMVWFLVAAGVVAVSVLVIASGFWALKRVLEILDDDVNDV